MKQKILINEFMCVKSIEYILIVYILFLGVIIILFII